MAVSSMVELDFPDRIGPFNMVPTKIHAGVNAFYQQNREFPKPDPRSQENSMTGLDPSRAGLGHRDILFCQLSPLHAITLDSETKDLANIPRESEYFAWAYPMVDDGSISGTGPEHSFLQFGGYMYFNARRDAIATNAISPASIDTLGLMFGRAQPLANNVSDTLTRQGRFQEITLEHLTSRGATHFAWIRPGEFGEYVASQDGCFAYKHSAGDPTYHPVVDKPVFTRELLEETLEEHEAWVVIRTRRPSIERPVIFDKRQRFEDNARECTELLGNIVASSSDVCVFRERTRQGQLSYADWQGNAEAGTIAQPWIMLIDTH